MANTNTSLNGYEFGLNPRTQAPFWGGSGEGAEIDDTVTVTDKTWSSKKISDELAEKADADDVYTKSQVDELLSEIPAVDAYTKTETDELLAGKAAVTSVYTKAQTYTKAEVDNLLSQIPAVDAYTKAQTDNLLADKANASDVYTKSQVDNLIPDVSGLATKSELNSGLAEKADASDLANYAKVTSVYTKAQTYTKAEVDDLISGATPAPVDAYTKAQTDSLLDTKADATSVYTKAQTDTLLADKANASDVYTKTQTDNLLVDKANSSDVYTKTQVDNLIASAGGLDGEALVNAKLYSSHTNSDYLMGSFPYEPNVNFAYADFGSGFYVDIRKDGNFVYGGTYPFPAPIPFNNVSPDFFGVLELNDIKWANLNIKFRVNENGDYKYYDFPIKVCMNKAYYDSENQVYIPDVWVLYPNDCGYDVQIAFRSTSYNRIHINTLQAASVSDVISIDDTTKFSLVEAKQLGNHYVFVIKPLVTNFTAGSSISAAVLHPSFIGQNILGTSDNNALLGKVSNVNTYSEVAGASCSVRRGTGYFAPTGQTTSTSLIYIRYESGATQSLNDRFIIEFDAPPLYT